MLAADETETNNQRIGMIGAYTECLCMHQVSAHNLSYQ